MSRWTTEITPRSFVPLPGIRRKEYVPGGQISLFGRCSRPVAIESRKF